MDNLSLNTEDFKGSPVEKGLQGLDKSLWANIRANRGSGKQPTPEMLEQERKIKASEKKKEITKAEGSGIPERYKTMGFTKVGQKKNSTSKGKKWMVLAKKGDEYKVVHGGDDSMKDFSQHKNEERQDAFWNRMGGKTGEKAKDPFSPLYWHKKFGTW